jgi:high-affinity iron transporter
MRRRLPIVCLLVCLGTGVAVASVPPETARAAERFLGLLRGIQGEYGEAFDDAGALVRPIELEEAALLLAEARDFGPRVGLDADAVPALEKAVADRRPQAEVEAMVRALATRVSNATGVPTEELPPAAPSVGRGAALFQENCSPCHGADGAGDGAESKRLGLTPANFTSPSFMRTETPDDFFNVVTLGRRRSGMPAWGDALGVQERWDVVRYVWTLVRPAPDGARGRRLVTTRCPDCATIVARNAARLIRTSDADIATALEGEAGGQPFADFDDAARVDAASALRAGAFDALVAADSGAARPSQAPTAREAFAAAHGLLDAALAARARGDAAAIGLATDAYMRFEPFEKRLGATEPGLVRRVEEGFVRLRQGVRTPDGDAELRTLVATLHRDLDTAATALEPGAGAWVRFAESAGIILREGFEVVLVVGALLAYVRRSGQPAMVRSLYAGSALGVAASVATAIVLVTALRVTPWAGEALEGAAMLLAAIVLFWVSYWLISKSEADRWQRYIRGKVQGALTARSGRALAAAAFLAVYREGFETILFYQALFAGAPAGDVMVPAGLVAGLVLLAIVYWGLERVGLRIPMGAFFVGTGAFLYAMAIVFAGRGVAELQEAALVPLTPIAWAPRFEVLGIFPTVESLAAQGVFVALLVYAVAVTIVRRRAARRATSVDAGPPSASRIARS